jgi:hypothetical protein
LTSATSEWAQGIFSKITFLKLVHSKEKDEACLGFLVKIFTKSVHRGGVSYRQTRHSNIVPMASLWPSGGNKTNWQRVSCDHFLGRMHTPCTSRFRYTCVRTSNLKWSHFAPALLVN